MLFHFVVVEICRTSVEKICGVVQVNLLHIYFSINLLYMVILLISFVFCYKHNHNFFCFVDIFTYFSYVVFVIRILLQVGFCKKRWHDCFGKSCCSKTFELTQPKVSGLFSPFHFTELWGLLCSESRYIVVFKVRKSWSGPKCGNCS